MTAKPSVTRIFPAQFIPERYDNHITRRLSELRGQFHDSDAYDEAIRRDDPVLYEVFELKPPEASGELSRGISVVHPGHIGDEYYMTKGHFHDVLETSEVYYCLGGRGMMVMETPEGDTSVEELTPGALLYVPPRWAHRSINTRDGEDLVTLFVYPAHAGHDYGTIESRGFRKLVVKRGEGPQVVDNPRWRD